MKKILVTFFALLTFVTPAFAGNEEIIRQLSSDIASFNSAYNVSWGTMTLSQQNDAKIKCAKVLDKIANNFVKLIPDYSPSDALKLFMKICNASGYEAFIAENEFNPGNFAVTANSKQGNMIELAMDETQDTASFTLYIGQAVVNEKCKKDYNPNKRKAVSFEAPFDMLETSGFDVADKGRSPDGNLILSKIKEGSAMAKGGALAGSDLFSVDGVSTQICTPKQLRDYIKESRGKTVTVIFLGDDGKQKTLQIRLQ